MSERAGDARAAAASPRERVGAVEVALLVALLVAGLLLRLGDFTEPWTSAGWQQVGAVISVEARNFHEQGWWTLRFAPALDVAPPPDGHWDFYMHHPPGLALLVSLSFALFGVAEWSARLVPVVASLLELLAIWALTRRLFGRRAALVAAALCATLPATAFYGSLVDDIGPALMVFVAAAFALHLADLDRPARGTFAAQLAMLAAAAAVNWQGVEVAGVLGLHYVLQRRLRRAVALFALALIVPALHLLHIRWAMGAVSEPGRWGTLLDAFLWRSWGGVEQFGGAQGSADRLSDNLLRLYTLPALLLAALGLLRLPRARWPWALVALAAFALIDMAIFLEGSARHEYWCTTLAPVLLPLAGAGAVLAVDALARRAAPAVRGALLGALVLGAGGWGAWLTEQRFDAIESTQLRDLGTLIREHTQPGDNVTTCEMITYPMLYYAQRRMQGEVRDENLARLRKAPPEKPGHWFMLPERKLVPHEHEALLEMLQQTYAETLLKLPDGSAVHLFDLSRRR
jgi:4-amino-4-deoxy-L-arabinose transferase-like glycosyltransferase